MIGELASTIAAGGSLTGTLSDDVTNITAPIVDVEDRAYGPINAYIVRTKHSRDPTTTLYTNPARFKPAPVGSHYFLGSLTTPFNADDLPRRLGDAYYDTQAISQQIFDQTGRRNLLGQSVSLQEQMQSLLSNGAAFANNLNLTPGIALTPEQQASLTNDMVWYETIDYNGESVLAPRLYLASLSAGNMSAGAARITAGNDLDLNATNIVNVNGTISSDNNLRLAAAENITINCGVIDGNNIVLNTGDNILLSSYTEATGNGENVIGTIYRDQVRIIAVNDLSMTSGENIGLAGVDVTAGNDVDMTAGNSVSIGTTQLRSLIDSKYKKVEFTSSSTQNIGSSINAGNDVGIQALNNVIVTGSDITAGNDLALDAAIGDVTIQTAQDETYSRFYKNSGSGTRDDTSQTIINQVSSLTSSGDTTLRSGLGNINLEATEIDSGGDINLEASSGEVNIAVVKDLDYYSNNLDRDNGIWVKAENKGHHKEEIKHTILTGEGDLNITTAKGVTVQYEQTGDLTESINQLSQAPGLSWMADLQNDPNVDWQAVQAINREWNESHEGLSGPAAAVIAIAVAVVTQGMGAQFAGYTAGTTGAATSNAAFSALASQASISLINNKGNLGATFDDLATSETVRNVAAAAITAGLIKEFGGELLSQPDGEVTLDIVDDIQKQLITAGIKTGVDATVSGADLSDSLKQNLRFGSSALIGAQLSQEIGAAFHDGDINRTAQLIAHTATGCVAGAVGTGNCSANAVAQVTGEIASIIHGDLTVDEIDDVTQSWTENNIDMARLAGALSAAIAGGDADDVNLGADLGGVAAENNNLKLVITLLTAAVKTGGKLLSKNADDAAKATAKLGKKTKIDDKIQDQMTKRGWDDKSINETIVKPYKTVKTRDTRNNKDGTRNNDPATGYINKDGSYVVRNDKTGDIVQVSDKFDPNWKMPW